ncbi:hypothetical protein [Candidatus Hecatella orcuttiae]|jgi:DNA replication initiation complex subunit (GINS family)|uniref:DNA replication complex subunit Gins51 n=1 Tax=Candidatus Hecatella orcuttiae TaxID=1935119 RepID=UPI0028683577|nr:hypothetical protein [Candidatus Hecatella orcuttiae]
MFKDLYEAWRKESETEELSPLNSDFYAKLSSYLKKLDDEVKDLDKGSLKARLKIKEKNKATLLASDLIHLRLKKMAESILLSDKKTLKPPLGEEEKAVYEELQDAAKIFSRLKATLEKGEISPRAEEGRGGVFIRFLKESPALVGADLRAYGPFEVEDVACLPPEIAEGLIKYGVAKRVELS